MADVAPARRPMAAYYLSLIMIAAGTVGLMISAGQYHAVIRHLYDEEFWPIAAAKRAHTPTLAITIVLALTGVFAFLAVLLRVR